MVVNGNDIAVRNHDAPTDDVKENAHFHVTRSIPWEILIESCCLLVVLYEQQFVDPVEYEEEEERKDVDYRETG